MLIFLGVKNGDTEVDAEYLAERCASLRIFDDEAGKMNLSVKDVKGEAMVVSQFTLYGDTRKGNRPSYTDAAPQKSLKTLYDHFTRQLAKIAWRETGCNRCFPCDDGCRIGERWTCDIDAGKQEPSRQRMTIDNHPVQFYKSIHLIMNAEDINTELHVVLLFLDGVGIGKKDANINPFVRARYACADFIVRRKITVYSI